MRPQPLTLDGSLRNLTCRPMIGQRASSQTKNLKKPKSVAMVMEKPSKSSNMNLMVMIFCMWHQLNHINLPAKNEWNLPCGFGDRPIATAWQPGSGWGSGGIDHVTRMVMLRVCDIMCDVIVTSFCEGQVAHSRIRDHVTRMVMLRVCDVMCDVIVTSFCEGQVAHSRIRVNPFRYRSGWGPGGIDHVARMVMLHACDIIICDIILLRPRIRVRL